MESFELCNRIISVPLVKFFLIIYFPLQDTAAKSSAKLKTKLKGLYAGRTPRSRTAFSSTVIKSWVVQENWGLKIS